MGVVFFGLRFDRVDINCVDYFVYRGFCVVIWVGNYEIWSWVYELFFILEMVCENIDVV